MMTDLVKVDSISDPTRAKQMEQTDLDTINTALYAYWRSNPPATPEDKFYVVSVASGADAWKILKDRGWV
jgi:hypothetical protein